MKTLEISVLLDEHGYLADPFEWTVNIAEELAMLDGLPELGAEHWKLIAAIRHFFDVHGHAPLCKHIIAHAGFTKDRVYEMFPTGYHGAYKVAGLPKPLEC